MIGRLVTDAKGIPLDSGGRQLSPSKYQPHPEVVKLFYRCFTDYQSAWQLQHRPFDEFDGLSLLARARLDQQTFGAYVGAQWVPAQKRWRWRGRKNTARNKIIGILAQMLAAILIPTVQSIDDQDNDNAESAKVMRILLEEHLRRTNYEIKFLYMVLSALVNPATFVQVEYIQAFQRVKVKLKDGTMKVEEAIDEVLSGLNLNIVPIDELMLGDFFTFDMQRQPYLVRVRRISWDDARRIYAGKYFDEVEGVKTDRFDFVQAGKTRVFVATQENMTLYDVDWTEADANMVQEATFYYRGEDLEVTFVGGVFMGEFDPTNPAEVYNLNPMKHRRMTYTESGWGSIPMYPYAKSGFEPLDPQMRFAYFKSAAFKEFWDDATLNMAHQLLIDGMHLDVMKPIFISGVSKYDSSVMTPGAVASLPKEAVVSPYQLGPNLAAAASAIERQEKDLADSTLAGVLEGQLGGIKQSSFAIQQALANAKRLLNVFSLMTANLLNQIGQLSTDCIIMNTTVGELNEEIPGALGLKYQAMLIRGKEKGKQVNNKIVFTDRYMGRTLTPAEIREREWELWRNGGGDKKEATRIWEVNPYQLARKRYTCFIDVEEILDRSTGADRKRKTDALNILTDPRVAPFTDPEAVINDFAIEEYGGNDPDKYKKKGDASAESLMQSMGAMKPQTGEAPDEVEPAPPTTPIIQ